MTATHAQPTVSRWYTPPENQGQIVEISYGVDDDGDYWHRTIDRSGPVTTYRPFIPADADAWAPWNKEPEES